MELLTTKHFHGNALDCYVQPEQRYTGEFWATREQIGTLLEYSEPRVSIANIHNRNKERLDKFSAVINLITPSGTQATTVYSFKGLLEICRYSNQPKANDIMDWLFDVADEIRQTGSYSVGQSKAALIDPMQGAKVVFDAAGITGNQLALALDRLYKTYTGQSALEGGEVTLTTPTQHQLLTPTQIGKYFGMSSKQVNKKLAYAGYQRKVADRWEATEQGSRYAVMQDVGKWHGGVPVRQLKWDSAILDVFCEL